MGSSKKGRSMGKIRRKFETEFKRKVVAEIATGAMTLTGAARQYDVSPTVIKYWQKHFAEGTLRETTSARERELEKENRALKAKIGDLVMEVDTLKKMEVYAQRLRKLNTSAVTASNLHQFNGPAK
jgi:transposase-like protein